MMSKGKGKSIADEVKKEGKVLKGEKSKDKSYSSVKKFADEETAKKEFRKSRERLFYVNGWTDIPGVANAAFALYNFKGEPSTEMMPAVGDFIRIDLPGPLPMYWVKVLAVTDTEDTAEFIVQPSHEPSPKSDKEVTEHFFQDNARSIFRVQRQANEIIAMEIGVNEAINNDEAQAGNKAKGVLNTLVSEGAWAGFQKYQWKNLTDYLVGISGNA